MGKETNTEIVFAKVRVGKQAEGLALEYIAVSKNHFN